MHWVCFISSRQEQMSLFSARAGLIDTSLLLGKPQSKPDTQFADDEDETNDDDDDNDEGCQCVHNFIL